ncbi:MBG domain-containing protein, partial [Schlesneria paludicola]|uniref:MBG domain-containing protein n=1 Tax=Schlesneria paludicola TaxID=360056 RepID=UPI00029AB1B4
STTLTYYVGTSANGSSSTTAPTNAGTYTVVATFTSSNANYGNASSAPVTFTITKAVPAVVVTNAGGTFNGNPFPATVKATGIGGAVVSGSTTLAYYVGTSVSGTGTTTAPTNAGTYTVVVTFTSSNANYGNASSAPVTFTITKALPTVVVTNAGGTFNGNPFPATVKATGIGGAAVSGSTTLAYYVGTSV